MSKNQYTWVLLDLDNTIFDFTTSSRLAFLAFMKEFGFQVEERHYPLYKEVNARVWKKLEQGKISSDEVKWHRFRDFFRKADLNGDPHRANECYLDHLVDNFLWISQAEQTIDYLKGSYRLGAVTNGLEKVQRPRLKRSGAIHQFDVIVVSEEIGSAKPQKKFFDIAFNLMGHPEKQEVIIVGDNLSSDIKGGAEYGIDTCWYNYAGIKNDSDHIPRFEIRQLNEIRDIL
jgi:putative hydrolase of the HAD superfamily